jgi:type IV pilus assembly protein PilQ
MRKGFFHLLIILMASEVIYGQDTIKPQNQLEAINFRQKGEISQLELVMSNDKAEASMFIVGEDRQIILDIKDTTGNRKVLRGLDTSEYSGSVVYISPYKKPNVDNEIRVMIQLRENVRAEMRKIGNRVFVDIENRFGAFNANNNTNIGVETGFQNKNQVLGRINIPKSENLEDILENLTQSGRKKYIGKKISLNTKELPVEDILRALAESSGFNIILTKDVKELSPLALSLTNTPWDQVLDTILDLKKLVVTKNGTILLVKTIAEATQDKEEKERNRSLNSKQEPRVTKVIPLSYAQTAEIRVILQEYLTPGSSETAKDGGTISEDVRTNSIIVKDTESVLERLVKIVEVLDLQTPQVLIESKIVEVSESHSKNLGVDGGFGYGYDPVGDIGASRLASPTSIGSNPEVGGGLNAGPGFSFNTAGQALATGGTGVFGIAVKQFGRVFDLNFRLQLLEEESKAKVISSPKVVAQNKKKAVLSSLKTVTFLKTEGVGDNTVTSPEQLEANISLEVTPQVTNEGSIALEINVKKEDFIAQKNAALPPDKTGNSVSTNVLVENGSTIVIGGIYEYSKIESHSGVPILKDIPLLGWLFRSPYNPAVSKKEVVIFITPRIINQKEAGIGG